LKGTRNSSAIPEIKTKIAEESFPHPFGFEKFLAGCLNYGQHIGASTIQDLGNFTRWSQVIR
jgi:hypothetical protein